MQLDSTDYLRAAYLAGDPRVKAELLRKAAQYQREEQCGAWAAVILPLLAGVVVGIVIGAAIVGRTIA